MRITFKLQTIAAACAIAIASISAAHAQQSNAAEARSDSQPASDAASARTQSNRSAGADNTQNSAAGNQVFSEPNQILERNNAGLGTAGAQGRAGDAQSGSAEPPETMEQVNNAAAVVTRMEKDPQVRKLLQQAKGVFIVPQYGRAGLGIGARGGEGVMLVNNQGKWSNPVFYNIGGVSIGAQAGAEIGEIAMLLMNQKAVNSFMQENNFSLNAGAGLTIVNYTAKAGAGAGKGDVIVWSDTKGAFANLTVSVTDIHYDDDENAEFYNAKVSARDIISGKVKSTQAAALRQELSSGE